MDASAPPQPASRPAVVLIVDDEPEILLTLEASFRRHLPNVQVYTALGSAPALRILEDRPVDLILSDYRMPGMAGIDLLALARRLRPGVMGVMMTAYPEIDVAIRGVNERLVQRFLTKPFKAREVVEAVSELLEQRRAEQMREQAFARSQEVLRRCLDHPSPPPGC